MLVFANPWKSSSCILLFQFFLPCPRVNFTDGCKLRTFVNGAYSPKFYVGHCVCLVYFRLCEKCWKSYQCKTSSSCIGLFESLISQWLHSYTNSTWNFHKNTNEFTKEATFCKRALHVFHCFSLKNWRSLHLKVNCTWNFYIEVMYVNDFGEKLKDLAYLSVGHHTDFVSVKPIHLGFWTWIEWNHSDQRDKEPANDKNWAFVFFLFQPYCNVIFAFVVNRTTDFLGSAGSDQLKDKNRERSKFSCLCLP